MLNLIALLGAFLIVTAVIPPVYNLSMSYSIVDKPNARKVHQTPMPFVGAAIWAGVLLAVWLLPIERRLLIGVSLGGTVAFAVGFVDDFIKSRGGDLAAGPKFIGQIFAAILLFSAGVKVQFLSNPFTGGLVYLPDLVSLVVTVAWVVGVTNLINFMDGLDGLACGLVNIAALTMAVVSYFMGQPTTLLVSLVLVGVTSAFFRVNFNPARMFMGDAGAYFLGFMLAAVSVEGAFKSATLVGLLIPIIVLGLPIADTVFNIVRRLLSGKPVYVADKGHAHHRLLQAGLSHRQTVLVMYLISICFSLTALVLMFANK
ncbi:MAG: undecaprenyl/decaprenyl-phosphate alpha-N-acetylglucosaminyl 1-phosphate transferase [Peptococcaceae bacterium]|nr:undecaprenyl/decaprenyl-phosphate alpha-N-acetylglucosaminyl 1-phosphate transferase [Peptococcaceae bacterium]